VEEEEIKNTFFREETITERDRVPGSQTEKRDEPAASAGSGTL